VLRRQLDAHPAWEEPVPLLEAAQEERRLSGLVEHEVLELELHVEQDRAGSEREFGAAVSEP
jgi:hypothetical protein